MEEQNNPTPKDQELLEKMLEEAKGASEETAAEFEDTIGGGISPEMLANMDPVQLQQLLAAMQGAGKPKRARSFYSRKQTARAVRISKRKAARAARKVTARTGGGRTISRKRRAKKAA